MKENAARTPGTRIEIRRSPTANHPHDRRDDDEEQKNNTEDRERLKLSRIENDR